VVMPYPTILQAMMNLKGELCEPVAENMS